MTDIMEQAGLTRDGLDEVKEREVLDVGVSVAAAVVNDSIYQERRTLKDYDKVPWCAYFYYVGKEANGKRPGAFYQYVSHHRAIDYSELRLLTTYLALNGRRDWEERADDGHHGTGRSDEGRAGRGQGARGARRRRERPSSD